MLWAQMDLIPHQAIIHILVCSTVQVLHPVAILRHTNGMKLIHLSTQQHQELCIIVPLVADRYNGRLPVHRLVAIM